MADGGTRKCSAVEDYARRGACPPLVPVSGRGRIPRANWPYQDTTLAPQFVIPAKAGIQRGGGHGNVVRGLVPRSGGGGAGQNPPCQFAAPSQNSSPLNSSLVPKNRPLRRPVVRDSRHPIVNPAPNSSFRRRPESRRGREGRCKTARRWKITGTSPRFHPLKRPSQGHGDSGESWSLTLIRGRNPWGGAARPADNRQKPGILPISRPFMHLNQSTAIPARDPRNESSRHGE